MLAVSLGLLLVGSGVGIHLEELGEMPLDRATSFAGHLAEAIEARTERRAVLDDPLWPECRDADRCVPAIRARTNAEDLVMLRLYLGPTKIRLIAERLSLDGLRDARVEENVPRDAEEWSSSIAMLAERLFPEPPRPGDSTERIISTAPPEESVDFFDVAPWVVLGTSAVALAVGTGFGISHRSARSELLDTQPDDATFDATFDRMQSHGRAANGLLAGGLVGVAAGGVLLMFAD